MLFTRSVEHNCRLTLTGEDGAVFRFVYRSLAVLALQLAALVALLIIRRLHG